MEGKGNKRIRRELPESAWTSQTHDTVDRASEALAVGQLQAAVEPEAEALAVGQLQAAVEPEPEPEPEAEALADPDPQPRPALEADPQPQPEVEENVDEENSSENSEDDEEDDDSEDSESLIAAALAHAFQQSEGGAQAAYQEARRRVCNPRLHVPPPVLRGPGAPCGVWMTAAEVYAANASSLAVRYSPNGLLVGRAAHRGHLLPGIVDKIMFCCYVHWAGNLRIAPNFEVFIVRRGSVAWMPARDSAVPEQAFPMGMTQTGEIVYVARVFQRGRWRLGRVIPSEGACVLLRDAREVAVEEYEVLTLTP